MKLVNLLNTNLPYNSAGIYAAMDERGVVLWVGSTNDFVRRWEEHFNGNGGCPTERIYEFIVLEYEDNEEIRKIKERQWFYRLKPLYGQLDCSLAQQSREYNRGKRVSLGIQGLRPAYDPSPPVEDYNDALEDELRYLDTNGGD